MTIKQKAFVKKYIELKGNATQAAMDVYDAKNYNTAHVIGSENLQKLTILKAIEQAVEASGLTDEYISSQLKNAIDAGIGEKATNADALRGIEMVLKVKGAFPSKVQKSAHFRVDYRQELMKKSTKELENELKNSISLTNELMQDVES